MRCELLSAGVVLALAGLLTGCGGGGRPATAESQTSTPTTGASGTLFPAAAGVVFIEYDANGVELQRSTPSDPAGRFAFAAGLTGTRIHSQAAVTATTSRLPIERAALLVTDSESVEVTPLTTLLEQFTSAGRSRAVALQSLRRLAAACGTEASASVSIAAQGLTRTTGDEREALLRALDAYLNAFRRIGLGAHTEGLDWSAKLQQRRSLLTELCNASDEVFDDKWPSGISTALNARQGTVSALTAGNVMVFRSEVATQLLGVIGGRLASIEYPEIAPALEQRVQTWVGTERELALKLAELAWSGTSRIESDDVLVPATTRTVVDLLGSPTRMLSGWATSVGDAAPVLRFENRSDVDKRVGLSLNNNFLSDVDGVIAQVIAMPALRRDEPLHERAWRFVVEWRRHSDPISGGRFLHQPDLFLRSIGSGYCDDVATVLHWIWRGMGYDARVYGLGGHVVAEVKTQGRWSMYDADYGVYYKNRANQVASVEELANDGTLITQPLQPLASPEGPAYSTAMAGFYISQEDNVVEDWLSVPAEYPYGNQFLIPRGGYMEIVGGATYTMPTIYGGPGINQAPIRVWFPPGYTGTVSLPMVLADAQGDASINLLWLPYEATSAGLVAQITAFHLIGTDIGINEVTINRVGPGGLTLTLMANPLYFKSANVFTAGVLGSDLSGLVVGSSIRQSATN